MADIEKQIDDYDSKISSVEGKIETMTDKVKSLSASKNGKSDKEIEKIRREQLLLLKKIKILQKQMSDMRNTQLMMIINLGQDSQKLALDTAILQRNVSEDSTANPYFYSRKEKLPQYAAIAQKRTNMRQRGKNPGPWTSDLEEQELRSFEQEDGQDPVLAEVSTKMGQKKKNKKNKSKHMKKKSKGKGKSKGRSSRGSMRRRRR